MLSRRAIIAGLLGCGVLAAPGCAKRPPPRPKAMLIVQPQPPAERLQTPAALRLAARELECDEMQVAVWDKGRYIQIRGCNKLAYFVKRGPKQWERSGEVFALAPGDELINGEYEPSLLESGQLVPPKLVASPEIKLTRKEFLGLTRWEPTVSSDCVVRANGTLGYCYTLTDEGALIELTDLALKASKFQPATLSTVPVNATLVVTLKVDLGEVNCQDQETADQRSRCEANLKKLKALGTEPVTAQTPALAAEPAKPATAEPAKPATTEAAPATTPSGPATPPAADPVKPASGITTDVPVAPVPVAPATPAAPPPPAPASGGQTTMPPH